LKAYDEFEACLLHRSDELNDCVYVSLIALAKLCETLNKSLVENLCYRALLNDILDRACSKAYRHAASYYRKLLSLDKQIDDYRGKPDTMR